MFAYKRTLESRSSRLEREGHKRRGTDGGLQGSEDTSGKREYQFVPNIFAHGPTSTVPIKESPQIWNPSRFTLIYFNWIPWPWMDLRIPTKVCYSAVASLV